MTDAQIKHMVERFLAWRLPKPWNPDGGVSYQRPNYAHKPTEHDWPTGTNLFDFSQTEAMVQHMLEGLPPDPRDAENAALRKALDDAWEELSRLMSSPRISKAMKILSDALNRRPE